MLPPLFTPPIHMQRCTQRGRALLVEGGRGEGMVIQPLSRWPLKLCDLYNLDAGK
jgi:hypothetical protein